jgi:hypothetical protein
MRQQVFTDRDGAAHRVGGHLGSPWGVVIPGRVQ